MSSLVTFNGQNYIIPATGEVGWGNNVSNYLIAIAAGCLQKTGGAFTLSAETDFGASFGLKSLYYKSRAANVASTGVVRLANADSGIVWRNVANSSDLALTVNASNQLTFNGVPIESDVLTSSHILVGNASNIATDVAMSGDVNIDNTGNTTIQPGVVTGTKIASNTITNSNINAAAGIVYSKLSLTNSILDADINSAAGIVYSKLSLTNGIVNADVNTAAAIAYSKLSLALSIVNGDISTSAAIAYSKLNLTGSIVNADISASAAIVYSKLNLSGSIVNADISNTAAIAYSKLSLTNSIVNADINSAAAIVYSKLSLSNSIVNADINASAAIAYSKLNLTGSIVNADISASAAIAITKIAPGTANQVIGANSGATANEYKTLTPTTNQVTITNGTGTITFGTPQNIDTGAAVQFGSLALGGTLDASSILSLTSTTKGLLPPRMTTTQRNAISSPTDGLVVYDSSLGQMFLRAGGSWTNLSTGGGSGTVASGNQYQMAYYAANGTTVSGLANLVTDASGNINVTGQTSPNLYITSTSASGVQGRILASINSALYVQTQTNHPLYMTTNNGVTALGIDTNQRVLIGNLTSAVVQLELKGGSSTSGPATTGTTPSAGTAMRLRTTTNAVLDFGSNSTTYAWLQSYDQTGMGTNYPLALNPNGGQVLHPNGASGSPSIAFVNDTGLGFYRVGAGDMIFQVGGVDKIEYSSTKMISSVLILAPDGSLANPAYTYGSDQSTGWYRIGSGNVGLSCGGTKVIDASSSGVGILGTTTNNNAVAGFVGQTIQATVNTTNFPTSTQYGDATSISLTAGDWLVSVNALAISLTSTDTEVKVAISTTSGNSGIGIVDGDNSAYYLTSTTVPTNIPLAIPNYRISLSVTTTIYLKMLAVYSAGTPTLAARITAVRIR